MRIYINIPNLTIASFVKKEENNTTTQVDYFLSDTGLFVKNYKEYIEGLKNYKEEQYNNFKNIVEGMPSSLMTEEEAFNYIFTIRKELKNLGFLNNFDFFKRKISITNSTEKRTIYTISSTLY